MKLQSKPDFDEAMARVEAWFDGKMLGRPPVRFHEHNADFNKRPSVNKPNWASVKERWFDAEYQVGRFLHSVEGKTFRGETFPVFAPNLGPNIYAAYFGAEITFGGVTSWIEHCIDDWADVSGLVFSEENTYYRKIEELIQIALDKCQGKFMVGYTDLHGSLDCAADWRDPQKLCMDLFDCPEKVHELVELADKHFMDIFDHYDEVLKEHGQMSVNWMCIPSRGKMHVPSCDFTSMVSTDDFDDFYLPSLKAEIKHVTHNIFHLDGPGMIRHLDRILEQPEIHAIQWVQGPGDDLPIMQWVPLIRRIQDADKGVVVDIQLSELDEFMSAVYPEKIFLCIAVPEDEQAELLKKLEHW